MNLSFSSSLQNKLAYLKIQLTQKHISTDNERNNQLLRILSNMMQVSHQTQYVITKNPIKKSQNIQNIIKNKNYQSQRTDNNKQSLSLKNKIQKQKNIITNKNDNINILPFETYIHYDKKQQQQQQLYQYSSQQSDRYTNDDKSSSIMSSELKQYEQENKQYKELMNKFSSNNNNNNVRRGNTMNAFNQMLLSKIQQFTIFQELKEQEINILSIMDPYYQKLQEQIISQITKKYFKEIHCPHQQEKLSELLFFQKEKASIHQNHLAILEGIKAQQISNRNIDNIIDQAQALFERTHKKNKVFSGEKIKIPELNFDKLRQNEVKFNKNQESYSDESQQQCPLTTNRQRKGRRYYLQKKNSKHLKGSQQSSPRKQTKLINDKEQSRINCNNFDQASIKLQEQKNNTKSDVFTNEQQKYLQNFMKQLFDIRTKVDKENEEKSLNNAKVQGLVDVSNNPKRTQNFNNTNHLHNTQVSKMELQLQNQYQNRLKQVIYYQIEHLKQENNLLMKRQKKLQQAYKNSYKDNKYKKDRIQISYKKKSITNKLQKLIKQFWQVAKPPTKLFNNNNKTQETTFL